TAPGTPERVLAHIFLSLPFPVTIPYRGGSVTGSRSEELDDSGRGGAAIASVCATGSLSNRWLYTGHSPPSDLYESSTFLSRSPRSIHMAITCGHNKWLGTITAPSATSTHGFAAAGASGDMPRSTVSVPASQSHRLMMHVSTMTPSYATLLRGSLLAMAFPVVTAGEHTDIDIVVDDPCTPARSTFIEGIAGGHDERLLNIPIPLHIGRRESKLPQRLDRRSYRIISLGFLLSTLGILPGAVRANEAWGYHWNRDPKETRALITRLTFAIHLHTRISKGWRGEGPAIVASSGFPTTRIRHSGVNPSGRGLHSHGRLIQ
uniref:Cytochrome c heme attachment protein n=1 Tax=Selaginella indica TaxID=189559 RepID=A0A410KKH0_9TRAC|nr:cytochrome c heme attachment protein [Selaginella indica]QAR48698.1 cytochrome c heme attachment protein [Selaginella indica]